MPLAVVDAAETLASPTVLRILHTKEGAKAACLALAALNAKGRKQMIKGFKGQVMKVAKDETGHVLIIAALSFVDDTALLKKSVLSEMTSPENLLELATDKWGRRVLLQLLSPDNSRYIPPVLLPLLHPTTIPVTAEDVKDKNQKEEKKEKKKKKASNKVRSYSHLPEIYAFF